MTTNELRRCADCGALTRHRLLCDDCATLCNALTREGLYHAYRTGRLDLSELPVHLRPLARHRRRPAPSGKEARA